MGSNRSGAFSMAKGRVTAKRLAANDAKTNGAKTNEAKPKVSPRASPTDGLNQEIIKLLQEDGRMPYDVIAAKLEVSAGTVRNRVNWMREADQLSIVAVVDPAAADYAADAMLGIKVSPTATPESVASRLGAHQEVVYILWVAGRYDLLVELVCDAEQDLTYFLTHEIHQQPDIAQVEVMTSIGMFKNQFLLKRHVS